MEITVTKISAANRLYNGASTTFCHRRPRGKWAVALKRTGKTYYTCGDKTILSDANHPVILPKGCCYKWQCTESGECLLIEFDALQECDEIFSFSVADSGFIESAFLEIQKKLHSSSPEAQLACFHRLYGVLMQLAKASSKDYIPKRKQALLQPAADYLSDHYFDAAITNDRLAAMCGISTVYFRKCFEAVYGISPMRYLHGLRIQKAKDILISDYGTISQVAESVGYASVYHFSKMFRIYTGISPTEYAKATRP